MTHLTRRGLLGLASLALLVACSPFSRHRADDPATIIFENAAMDQATVYVVAAGSDFRRIGTVGAARTEVLDVPVEYTNRGGTLNIVVRMLAQSDVPQTGPVTMVTGERYRVRLPPDAKMLTFLPAP